MILSTVSSMGSVLSHVCRMNGVKCTVSRGHRYCVSNSIVLQLNHNSCPSRLCIKETLYAEHCVIRKKNSLSEFKLMLEVTGVFWHSR